MVAIWRGTEYKWVNRQSCDPSTTLLFKLVLAVVEGYTRYLHNSDGLHLERPSPLKAGRVTADRHLWIRTLARTIL